MRSFIAALMLCLFAMSSNAEADTCVASFYGAESGPHTASGERFIASGMTAAMPGFRAGQTPFNVRVTLGERSVTVRVNDRGPVARLHRCIDLSEGAARRIGCGGVCHVQLEIVSDLYKPSSRFPAY